MNNRILNIFRGMTDGYVVNIGNPEDTSVLGRDFQWDSLNLEKLVNPLHETFEEHRVAGLIHYFTISNGNDAYTLLKEFFEKIESILGWKRRIIVMRIPHSEEATKYLTDNYYTFIQSEDGYDYFIHTIWDVLV